MAGTCESCGKTTEALHTCESCGAKVCSECKEHVGCKMCGGIKSLY